VSPKVAPTSLRSAPYVGPVQPWSRLPYGDPWQVFPHHLLALHHPSSVAATATPLQRYCDLDEMYARSALMSAGLSLCSGMGML